MSRWKNWERVLRYFAVPNLTMFLIAGQVMAYAMIAMRPEFEHALPLTTHAYENGQWWRFLTFAVNPSFPNILFFVMGMMFLHFMGNVLESTLGIVKYNLFVLVGYLASIAVVLFLGALVKEDIEIGNHFIYGSIFLAFAFLYPDFEILMFFVLPVKVKWLALLTLISYIYILSVNISNFTTGGWIEWLLILAANLNLFLFFGKDMWQRLMSKNKQVVRKFQEIQNEKTPRHTCVVCGATNLSHPDRDFRYCTDCTGTPAYCNEHLSGHEHRTENKV